MPEYRRDPITGRIVIIAAERATRPHQFDIEISSHPQPLTGGTNHPHCPFCGGNEPQTTLEVAAFRNENTAPNTPGWQVRVVPNKYPAVVPMESNASRNSNGLKHCSAFRSPRSTLCSAPAFGQHEVIIDTPRHILSVSEMTEEEVFQMFRMYQERIKSLRNENQWDFVQIFKNVGAAAGASIPHSHSQLIALPFVPSGNEERKAESGEWRVGNAACVPLTLRSSCPYCELLTSELRVQTRIVEETEFSVALCPFASRFAGEVEVYPKRHCSSFDFLNEDEVRDFALLVQRVIVRLEQEVTWMKGPLAYNLVLHTEKLKASGEWRTENGELENANGLSKKNDSPLPVFHCQLSILPSLTRAAGFEWGTGLHINPFPPELAAERLRKKN